MMLNIPHIPRQRGMVLVTALLLLVVVTLLGVGMFRSFGLDEKIAGNVREKQRALSAAETAEQFAEYWLANGHASPGVACTSPPVSSAVGQICTTPLANPTTTPWTVGVNYLYAPSTATTMNTSTSGGQGTYYQIPQFHIAYLGGTTLNGQPATLYQIDAAGYGGSPDTVAVVEAIYAISTSTSSCSSCGQ
jgi:type IV pilus assembly protein PilX